jgi:hypothetical protein
MRRARIWLNHRFSTARQVIELIRCGGALNFHIIGSSQDENAEGKYPDHRGESTARYLARIFTPNSARKFEGRFSSLSGIGIDKDWSFESRCATVSYVEPQVELK